MNAERCSMRAAPNPECSCGCGVVNLKTQLKTGHVVGCACPSCRGRRYRRKGQKGQAKMHRRLGGEGFTPTNEESARPYHVECLVMPESKVGGQIPASWDKFVSSEFFRRALSQSERAVPFGSGALPCVVLRGDFAVVDIRRRKK